MEKVRCPFRHEDPQEPRTLAEGKIVYVQTRSCGLHRITGLDTDKPTANPPDRIRSPGKECFQASIALLGSIKRYSF
jgi:hypothetical protein